MIAVCVTMGHQINMQAATFIMAMHCSLLKRPGKRDVLPMVAFH